MKNGAFRGSVFLWFFSKTEVRPSRASPLPHWFCERHRSNVGAGLLAKASSQSPDFYAQNLNQQIPRRPLPQHFIPDLRTQQRPPQRRSPIDQSAASICLILAHQLHTLLVALFISKRHPSANLHFVGGGGRNDNLGALQALIKIPPVTLKVGLALFIGQFALCTLFIEQVLYLGEFHLKQGQPCRGDVVGLRADLPFHWLVGLRGGVIFIDEGTAHGFLPL